MEAKFNKIYTEQTFFDRYNGSIFATFFFLFVCFIVFSYSYIQTRITPIKNNWTQERCSPIVIPFAGLINPPPNKSKFQFTYENFNFCINTIIKDMVGFAIKPIEAIVNLFTKTFEGFETAINDIRKIVSGIRSSIEDVSTNIMERILNILIPFQKMVIKVKEVMGRAHATMVTGMYTSIGALWFLISALLNVYNFIIALLIGLAATAAALWLIPFFGWPEAIAATAAFVAISIPTGIIAAALETIITITGVNQSVSGIPPGPSCFKKGTLIRAMDNTLYSIECIPLGTTLAYGGKVTAVLKLDASRETMYKLGNVTVSGSHKVLQDGHWVYVRDHKKAVELKDFIDKEIYCLNTTKKKMGIGDFVFQDWDEVDKSKLFEMNYKEEEDIYNNLENGFHESTFVNIKGRGSISITEVNIGDQLDSGERVVGTVKIINDKPLYEYTSGFLGTRQFSVIQDLGRNPVPSLETADTLYHILTDKGTLHIKEQKIMDYNWNIDFFNIVNMYK